MDLEVFHARTAIRVSPMAVKVALAMFMMKPWTMSGRVFVAPLISSKVR